jgi:hypothetical protein
MNIAKLIKGYFIFVMAISSVAVFSYNDSFSNYVVSVLHSDNSLTQVSPLQNVFDKISSENYLSGSIFTSINQNPSLINFLIESNPEGSFAEPGSQNSKVMTFSLKADADPMVLESLKLKVVGIDSSYVGRATLSFGDYVFSKGRRDGDYFIFDNLNIRVAPNGFKTFDLLVNISSEVKTGNRFRFDIESPDDIGLNVNGETYIIDGYYPIKGTYLSIARPRTWGIDWNKKDK